MNSKHQLLSVATARTVSLADSLALNGKSYFPEIYQQRFSADLEFLEALNSEVIKANFYSPLSISKDSATAQGVYSELGDFENLELFGVAQACSHFNIKWNNLSVITNYLGTDAHHQWQENYSQAATLTLAALRLIGI